tara:strand:+ start:185 stop:448 length:264 start_codon:yes stop_codon:yes gene_type:complete
MLARSLVAVFLSLPACVAVMGVMLTMTPVSASITLPLLLMMFPLWVGLTCGSYLIPNPKVAAAGLVGLSLVGFGLIALLKWTGLALV